MRNCGLDLDCVYDLHGSVCISTETNAIDCYMLFFRYRGVFKADKHIVMAKKA